MLDIETAHKLAPFLEAKFSFKIPRPWAPAVPTSRQRSNCRSHGKALSFMANPAFSVATPTCLTSTKNFAPEPMLLPDNVPACPLNTHGLEGRTSDCRTSIQSEVAYGKANKTSSCLIPTTP